MTNRIIIIGSPVVRHNRDTKQIKIESKTKSLTKKKYDISKNYTNIINELTQNLANKKDFIDIVKKGQLQGFLYQDDIDYLDIPKDVSNKLLELLLQLNITINNANPIANLFDTDIELRLSKSDSIKTTYLQEINQYETLTAEDQEVIATKSQNGNIQAKIQFCQANLKLVIQALQTYPYEHDEYLDLIQEGNLGLLKAIDKYNPSIKTRFSTYAIFWIRHYIERYFVNKKYSIRIPVYLYKDLCKYRTQVKELTNLIGRTPTDLEIADRLNLSLAQIYKYKQLEISTVSLDADIQEEGHSNYQNLYTVQSNLHNKIYQETAYSILTDIISNTLSTQEQNIIKHLFGFEEYDILTDTQITKKYKLKNNDLQQIKLDIFNKIRQHPECHKLDQNLTNAILTI